MTRSRREEKRLLSQDEHELVAQSHHPAIKKLSDADLTEMVSRLRERRDRAQDIARRQRREMRGKAAPSGISVAKDNTGSRAKADVIAAAVRRANKEVERRRVGNARQRLTASASNALEFKREADANNKTPPSANIILRREGEQA